MVIMTQRQSSTATWSSLHELLFGKRIEFVAPFAPEECVVRLEERSHRHAWLSWSKCLAVQVHRKDADRYGFRLHKDAGHNLDVWVLGDLQRLDEHSTLVRGYGLISPFTYLLIILALPLAWAVTQNTSTDIVMPLLLLALPGIGIATCWITSVSARNALIRTVYYTLGEEVL
jgi:hypothetical protein